MGSYIPLTEAPISGTGTIEMSGNHFGGAVINMDGTNAVVVQVKENNAEGRTIFYFSGKFPVLTLFPTAIQTYEIYYSITGTGASAMLYEYI